jgi:hypothetical protein
VHKFAAAAVLALLASFGSLRDVAADPLSYDFTWVATTGPLAGMSATGTFEFDSAIVPATGIGVSVDAEGLFTAFEFTWNGVSYDETTVNTGRLVFSNGELILANFGTNCTAGPCMIAPGSDDWFSRTLRINDPNGSFAYGGPNDQTTGRAAFFSTVPEPGSLVLVIVGLFTFAVTRTRSLRRHSA